MFDIISPYFDEVVTATLGGFIGWFFTRKRQNVDIKTTEIENDSKLVGLYKDALDDLPARYEERYKHLEEMSKNIEALFEKKEQVLLQEIAYQKKQVALYKKMYDDKVKEFNKYKREHP
ncbi:hypothetical protein GCM10008015_26900 [Flavobacterium palustre]|uniref:Uncharacterized protein n=1 Tax=Flavobacterium palustre TaxID=1476463 RepID=A0ABQ1HQ27_9FLAO|nr:hypothetical protein [Flavobacterium palustre]GGA84738.1 hypothetical protein GCM10008015_26900 [Flavobacterium palustre]